MFYISYRDLMLKRNNFFIFLSTRFGGKCKHTELDLNFLKKSILVKETHFPLILVE